MSKDDPSPPPEEPRDDPQRDENARSPSPEHEQQSVPGVGERTVPNILESTIESIPSADSAQDVAAEDVPVPQPGDGTGGVGVGEKTIPNVLETTIESIPSTDPTPDLPTSDSDDDAADSEKTQPNVLESTVESVGEPRQRIRKKKVRLGSQLNDLDKTTPSIEETIAPFGIGESAQTLGADDLEQAVSDGKTVADFDDVGNAGDSPSTDVDGTRSSRPGF